MQISNLTNVLLPSLSAEPDQQRIKETRHPKTALVEQSPVLHPMFFSCINYALYKSGTSQSLKQSVVLVSNTSTTYSLECLLYQRLDRHVRSPKQRLNPMPVPLIRTAWISGRDVVRKYRQNASCSKNKQ